MHALRYGFAKHLRLAKLNLVQTAGKRPRADLLVLLRPVGNHGRLFINIAGPEVLSIRHIAQQIGEQIGVEPLFELALQPRAFDLIADVSKLVEIFNPIFVPFAEGIKRTLND